MNLLNDCDEAGGFVIDGHEGKEEGGGQFGHNRSRYNNSSLSKSTLKKGK